jgi:hypothetical protein
MARGRTSIRWRLLVLQRQNHWLPGSKAVTFSVAGKFSAINPILYTVLGIEFSTDTISNRFISPDIAKKYDLHAVRYVGIDQVVEIENNSGKL